MDYYEKYAKYKRKYLDLKKSNLSYVNARGGVGFMDTGYDESVLKNRTPYCKKHHGKLYKCSEENKSISYSRAFPPIYFKVDEEGKLVVSDYDSKLEKEGGLYFINGKLYLPFTRTDCTCDMSNLWRDVSAAEIKRLSLEPTSD